MLVDKFLRNLDSYYISHNPMYCDIVDESTFFHRKKYVQ